MDNFLLLQSTPELMRVPITLGIILFTVLTSYRAMNDHEMRSKLIFNAAMIHERKEWYRFWSHGLIHNDWMHLAVNMFVLYMFGSIVEQYFVGHFGQLGRLYYILLYGLGLAAASLYSFYQHRYNWGYNALGASGAVSGIVFAFILLAPLAPLGFLFLPFVEFPAIVLGIGYLIYSQVMSKRGRDNIGHDAHFWGAVWGFAFTLILDIRLGYSFVMQIAYALNLI